MAERPEPSQPSRAATIEWTPVSGSRASAEIVDQITRAFFAGMKAGEWIGTETELAKSFGVSRITARDAIRILETRGVVEVRVGAHGGVRVARADPRRLRDSLGIQLHLLGVTPDELLGARIAMEPATAALAAARASTDDLDLLRDLLEEALDLADDAGRRAEFTASCARFHGAVVRASHNRALEVSVLALHTEADPTALPCPAVWRRPAEVCAAHRAILDSIQARDPETAERLLHQHLEDAAVGPPTDGIDGE